MSTGGCDREVLVESKEPIADQVVAVTLRDTEGRPLPAWTPGAHIDMGPVGAPLRQYSLCGDPRDRHRWRLAVRREGNGRGGSRYVHDRLRAGDRVRVRGPRNTFPMLPAERYLFIAGGIGITPILPMVAAAHAAGADWRLHYIGRRRAGMAFLDELARHGDRVTVYPRDETGRPGPDTLLGAARPDTLVYCCGPESLLDTVRRGCAGRSAGVLHLERFAVPVPPASDPGGPFEVVLARSGRHLTVPAGRSVLSVVERAGVPVLSGCSEGVCGTCETRVLEGRPQHRDAVLSEAEQQAGDRMLICVSRSWSERLVLDL